MKEGRGAGTRRRSTTAKYDPASDAPTQRVESDGALEKRLRAALAPNLLLVRAIGAGGMARVFLARQPALKRLVAVKVLSGDLAGDPDARKRFEREAQAVAALSHPNIVAIHSVGELDDGTPYFVMQYVEGRSMAARVEQDGPLSLSEARRVIGEVAAALVAAHRQGIIHRDIKPANILYEESSGRALVSDFGIAAMTTPAGGKTQTRLTGTGMALGTPQYMSPEQLSGEAVTDRTDVYSLGLLAHELLAGSGPYRGSSAQELIAAHLRDTAPRLSVRRVEVDPELDELVARCLEKDATKRPSSAEIARRLAPGGAALLEWPPPGLEPLHGRIRRLAMPLLSGSVLLLASLVGIIAAGPRLSSAHVSTGSMLLFLAAAAGAVLVLLGIRHGRVAGAAIASAIRDGFGWMTVLETLVDTRGDTGHIITGSREYAALDLASRNRYRRWRVLRELALLTAGVVIVPLLLVALLAVDGRGVALALAVLVPLVLLAGALTLLERERIAFAAHRRRSALATADDRASLAASWYAGFDAARGDDAIGRGWSGGAWVVRGAAIVTGLALLVSLALVVPLAVVGVIGPTYWLAVLPDFTFVKTQMREAEVSRLYVLERDPGISALGAGAAFHALLAASGNTTVADDERPPTTPLPLLTWRRVGLPSHLFRSARADRPFPGLPDSRRILAAARNGLAAEELEWLRDLAAAPHWAQIDLLARASRLDYYGARFTRDANLGAVIAATTFEEVYAMRLLGHASVARAAHFVAQQQPDSAELVLRRAVSAGILLMDDGSTLAQHLAGALMAAIARDGLISLWELQDDPRGRQLKARLDVVRGPERVVLGTSSQRFQGADVRDADALREAMLRTVSDPNESRGVRYATLMLLAQSPCTNLRELLLGPSAEVNAAFAAAASTWVRFPSDSILIDVAQRGTVAPQRARVAGPMSWHLARVASGVLRNPRFAGCASSYLGL